MDTQRIIEALDMEIARLQHVRDVLNGTSNTPRKRAMSAAGRARIAAAQRKRWAKAKKG